MHKSPINCRDILQHALQALTQVMTIPETCLLVQNNINLNNKLVTGMVCFQTLDLLNELGEPHSHIQQNVAVRCTRMMPLRGLLDRVAGRRRIIVKVVLA